MNYNSLESFCTKVYKSEKRRVFLDEETLSKPLAMVVYRPEVTIDAMNDNLSTLGIPLRFMYGEYVSRNGVEQFNDFIKSEFKKVNSVDFREKLTPEHLSSRVHDIFVEAEKLIDSEIETSLDFTIYIKSAENYQKTLETLIAMRDFLYDADVVWDLGVFGTRIKTDIHDKLFDDVLRSSYTKPLKDNSDNVVWSSTGEIFDLLKNVKPGPVYVKKTNPEGDKDTFAVKGFIDKSIDDKSFTLKTILNDDESEPIYEATEPIGLWTFIESFKECAYDYDKIFLLQDMRTNQEFYVKNVIFSTSKEGGIIVII